MINIFKRCFFHTKEQDIDDSQNPWAGLASYEDPETAERKLKFCGRDDDSYDLARLIIGNVFVTLYGKSGIGKTSLLNAGVFPELREEQYTPVSIRLGMRDDERPQSYQTMIVEVVERAVKRTETINVIDEQQDQQSIDYLWNYFARHRFYDKCDELTTPVIVFDQFEEVFSVHRDEAESLLRQLDYLNDKDHTLDNCEVDGHPYRYEQNFRFVVSIREDDLYRLEDSIDNCYLPALKRCRYRLRGLSEEGAKDAILIPGEGMFKPEEQDGIVNTIIDIARNKVEQSISTNLLSLVCSRIFVEFQNSASNHISPRLVDSFIKANPFERFYNEATRGFSNKEKSYIEDHLVDSTGRRNSISESDFLLHVPKYKQLLEGNTRILQCINTSSDGGNYRLELIHDSFCEPLSRLKEKREKQWRLLQLLFVIMASLLIAVSSYLIIHSLNERQKRMMENLSKLVAEKAKELVREGDAYTARLLALSAIEKTPTPEAEAALRLATSHETAKLFEASVRYATFSPNGNLFATASCNLDKPNNTSIKIWDAKNGGLIQTFGNSKEVDYVEFSPDGNYIVSASPNDTITLWDVHKGKETLSFYGHSSCVYSAVFSSDAQKLLSASSDGTAKLWNVKTGKEIRTFSGHTAFVKSAQFSPDEKYIVTASGDSTIKIWSSSDGKEIRTLKGHTGCVYQALYTSDGKNIVSCSLDKTIIIWDALTGDTIKILKGHSMGIQNLSISHNGKYLSSVSKDRTIKIWDIQTGAEIKTLYGHYDWVNSAMFSPNDSTIISTADDNIVQIWDLYPNRHNGYIFKESKSYANYACYSSSGRFMATAIGNTVKIYDLIRGVEIGSYTHSGEVKSVCFSLNEEFVVSGSYGTVKVWKASAKEIIKKFEYEGIDRASISPNYKYIVSAQGLIWDLEKGDTIGVLRGHRSHTYSELFSPDGNMIVTASHDRTIRIWDVSTRKELKCLRGHTNQILYASFSPDMKQIVSACGDGQIKQWNAKTGEEIRSLDGHKDMVECVSYSSDNKYISSASWDGTIRIWDAKTGCLIQTLEGHKGIVTSASFSPDCIHIVSSSHDGTIRIWDFPSLKNLIGETRERFKNRELTSEEKHKYYLE